MSARTISDLERGVWRTPRADSAAMLAAALDLDPPARAVWERIIRSERPSRRRGAVTVTPLPDARHAIVGRERLLGEVFADLAEFGGGIVTVAGAGGIGKTRLAREIAQRWLADDERSGVVGWVELAGLSDPAEALPEIGRALGLTHLDPTTAADRIVAALGATSSLLVLDNFEHLLPAAPEIAAIAAANPRHAVLVTSRQPLGVAGERLWQVPPLELPPPRASDAALSVSPPVACFLGKAQLSPESLAAPRLLRDSARIVRLLDGMPLAIELAAAQTALLPVGAIADLLEHGGLRLLEDTGGAGSAAAERQRTMSRAIAWSVDLLDANARQAFRLLSVFRGGMSLALATELLAGGGMQQAHHALLALVRASLLTVRDDMGGEPRYVMLEPIRLAGRLALDDAGEAVNALDRHASLMHRVAEEAYAAAVGSDPCRGFDLARRERMNLCAALDHAIASGDDALASGIANNLGWVWEMIEEEAQAARWFQRVVAMQPRLASPCDRFQSAHWALHYALLWRHPDQSAVARLHDLAAATGDREHLARAHLYEAATILFFEGLQDRADLELDRAMELAGDVRPSFARSGAAQVSGFVALYRERFAEAERWFSLAISQRRALGMVAFTTYPLALLGYARFRLERRDEAAAALIEALRTGLDIRHTVTIQVCCVVLAALALPAPATHGDSESARLAGQLLGAALKLDDRLWSDDDFASALAREVMDGARAVLGEADLQHALEAGGDLDHAGLMSLALLATSHQNALARTAP